MPIITNQFRFPSQIKSAFPTGFDLFLHQHKGPSQLGTDLNLTFVSSCYTACAMSEQLPRGIEILSNPKLWPPPKPGSTTVEEACILIQLETMMKLLVRIEKAIGELKEGSGQRIVEPPKKTKRAAATTKATKIQTKKSESKSNQGKFR